jgi:membrane fusion protein (multidrug efflux system)
MTWNRTPRYDVPITTTNTSSQLDTTASDVGKNRAGIVAAEKLLAAARAQVEQAQPDDVKAQHDLIRYRMLVDEEEVSRQTRTIGQRVPTRIVIEPGQSHDLLFRPGVNVAPKVFLR